MYLSLQRKKEIRLDPSSMLITFCYLALLKKVVFIKIKGQNQIFLFYMTTCCAQNIGQTIFLCVILYLVLSVLPPHQDGTFEYLITVDILLSLFRHQNPIFKSFVQKFSSYKHLWITQIMYISQSQKKFVFSKSKQSTVVFDNYPCTAYFKISLYNITLHLSSLDDT